MQLIRPKRFLYEDDRLGYNLIEHDGKFALRLDFQIKNALGEKINLTVYIPCDSEERTQEQIDYVVYCHTMSGDRTEGLYLLNYFILKGIGLVVFDFRANGYSSGKYVSLGWYEALDINQVVLFLRREIKANSIALWGRSMGASAIVFFMSRRYREEIQSSLKRSIKFCDPKWIDVVVIDSVFSKLSHATNN